MKNPFAVKDCEPIVISDLTEAERGEKCGCKCPHCDADFNARMGEIKRHHFAHAKGAMCDELAAYLMGLYNLIKHFIENNGKLYIPAVIVNLNISDSVLKESDFSVCEEEIGFYIKTVKQKLTYGKNYVVYEATEMVFDYCEIETNNKGIAETLILTRNKRKLAVRIKPHSTICKDFITTPYKDTNIATLIFDASNFEEEFYTLKSDKLKELFTSQKSLWYWKHNPKFINILPKIINDIVERRNNLLAKLAKENAEKQEVLEEQKRQCERKHINFTQINQKALTKNKENWRTKIYRQTGKFATGKYIKGMPETCELADIKLNKNYIPDILPYTVENFESTLEEAFSGLRTAVIMLIHKLYKSKKEEYEIFYKIYEHYANLPTSEENKRKLDIMHHIINETGTR